MAQFRGLAAGRLAPGAYGSLPARRVDQLAGPPSPGMLPAPPGNIVRAREIIVGGTGAGTGIFIYNGSPGPGNKPVLAAVPPGVTADPFGNLVTAVMYIGALASSHIQWDQTGTTTLFDSAGNMRLELLSASGRIEFFNSFGAVVFLIAPDLGALFFYQDLGSATQGSAIGAEVWATSNVTDPITGRVFGPGFTNLDPIAAGLLQLTPGNIFIGNFAGMSNQGHIAGISSSGGANQGFLGLGGGAPFATPTAPHATMQLLQTSPDGTRTPQLLIGTTAAGAFLSPSTLALVELQNTLASQTAFRIFMPAAAGFPILAGIVSADTFDRFTIDESGKIQWGSGVLAPDVNLFRAAANLLRTDGNMEIGGTLNIPSAAANPHFGVDTTGHSYWANAAGTQTIGSTLTGANSFQLQLNAGNAFVGRAQLATRGDIVTHTATLTTPQSITASRTIAANDALETGIIYRLEFRGSGTQGSTAQALSIGCLFDGGGPLTFSMLFPATFAPANQGFNWRAVIEVVITATGVGGTANFKLGGDIGFGGVAGILGVVQEAAHNAQAFDTTASHTVQGFAQWGSTTGAPTMTCDLSWFERVN